MCVSLCVFPCRLHVGATCVAVIVCFVARINIVIARPAGSVGCRAAPLHCAGANPVFIALLSALVKEPRVWGGGPTPFDVAVPVLMCTWTGRSERCLSAPRPRRCLFGSPLAQCLAAEANALFRFVSHALSIPSDFSPILSLFFPPLFFK